MIFALALLAAAPGELGPPDAMKRSMESGFAWKVCALENAARYAALDDSPELLIQAAMGRCNGKEQEFRVSLHYIAVDGNAAFLNEHVDQLVAKQRKEIEGEVLSAILETRLHQAQSSKKKN